MLLASNPNEKAYNRKKSDVNVPELKIFEKLKNPETETSKRLASVSVKLTESARQLMKNQNPINKHKEYSNRNYLKVKYGDKFNYPYHLLQEKINQSSSQSKLLAKSIV